MARATVSFLDPAEASPRHAAPPPRRRAAPLQCTLHRGRRSASWTPPRRAPATPLFAPHNCAVHSARCTADVHRPFSPHFSALFRPTFSPHFFATFFRHTFSPHFFATLFHRTFSPHFFATFFRNTFSPHFFATLFRCAFSPHLFTAFFRHTSALFRFTFSLHFFATLFRCTFSHTFSAARFHFSSIFTPRAYAARSHHLLRRLVSPHRTAPLPLPSCAQPLPDAAATVNVRTREAVAFIL